ncbi:MAG TPA: DUF4309 domain-containing protein [Fimbriimonadaceae bacterium]|jgi:hypothetical protein
MHAFNKVSVGATKDEVHSRFGEPTSSKPLADISGTSEEYDDRNYSFEFDKEDHLQSIRLIGYEGFADPQLEGQDDLLHQFRTALNSPDPDLTLQSLHPDVEISTENRAFSRE